MASIRNQIMDSIKTRLNAVGKPSGLTVELLRLGNMESVSLPHVLVRLIDEDVELASPNNLRSPVAVRLLRLAIDCRAAATGAQTIEDALDAITTWTTKAMLSDPRMSTLAITTEETGTVWDGEETAGGTYALATVHFSIRYRTKTADQEAKA